MQAIPTLHITGQGLHEFTGEVAESFRQLVPRATASAAGLG